MTIDTKKLRERAAAAKQRTTEPSFQFVTLDADTVLALCDASDERDRLRVLLAEAADAIRESSVDYFSTPDPTIAMVPDFYRCRDCGAESHALPVAHLDSCGAASLLASLDAAAKGTP